MLIGLFTTLVQNQLLDRLIWTSLVRIFNKFQWYIYQKKIHFLRIKCDNMGDPLTFHFMQHFSTNNHISFFHFSLFEIWQGRDETVIPFITVTSLLTIAAKKLRTPAGKRILHLSRKAMWYSTWLKALSQYKGIHFQGCHSQSSLQFLHRGREKRAWQTRLVLTAQQESRGEGKEEGEEVGRKKVEKTEETGGGDFNKLILKRGKNWCLWLVCW